MQYFNIGDEVIGKKTGLEFVVTGVVTEREYIDPLNGGKVRLGYSCPLPAYWLDYITKEGLCGAVIYQVFKGASLYKKYKPGISFDEIMSKLESPKKVESN